MSHTNNPDLFPNLNTVKLESFAHIWAKEHAFIKRISLYQVPIDGFDFRIKYVMFFELSEISKTDGYAEHDEQFIEVLEGPNGLISALATQENVFKEVYKHTPKDNFIDEWSFVTNLPEGIDEKYSWILFSLTDKEKTIKEITIEQDHEDFIRKLRVDYENNSEVKIQEPRRGPKNYNYVSLGFRSNENEIWNDFINILQYSPHLYKLGPAHTFSDTFKKRMRNREYDKKRRRLRIINKKLLEFFNNNFEVEIPENYNLYELCKEQGPGNYRFKFKHGAKIESVEILYEEYPEEQLVAEIEELGRKYHDTDEQVFLEKLVAASKIAITKGFLSDEEIKKIVYPEKEEYLPDDYLTVKKS